MDNTKVRVLAAGAVLAATLPLAAQAAEQATQGSTPGKDTRIFSKALPPAALDRFRGGTEVHILDIQTDGVVNDNVARDLTTGNNYITEGSFSSMTGFPTVIQNSGNNVLIQNSTNINLQVQ